MNFIYCAIALFFGIFSHALFAGDSSLSEELIERIEEPKEESEYEDESPGHEYGLDYSWVIELKKREDEILDQATNFSPIKKRSHSLSSPVKKMVTKRRRLDEPKQDKWRIIYSSDTEFHSGRWRFLDAHNPESSVKVNADDAQWTELVKNFTRPHKKIKNASKFITNAINYIHQNIEAIKTTGKYRSGDELVCRHFATFSLPFFAKVLASKDMSFGGDVHFLDADFVDKKWVASSAHAWNVLFITDKNGMKTQWFVDVYNRRFVNLSESPFLNKLTLCHVSKRGRVTNYSLSGDRDFLDWVKVTKEKFSITPRRKLNLYADEEAHKLAATKVLMNHEVDLGAFKF